MNTEFVIAILLLAAGFFYLASRFDRILALLGRPKKEDPPAAYDRREAIGRRIGKANDREIAGYLAQGFGLSEDDPWIASVVTTRKRVGLEAAVTMIVEMERELRNNAK